MRFVVYSIWCIPWFGNDAHHSRLNAPCVNLYVFCFRSTSLVWVGFLIVLLKHLDHWPDRKFAHILVTISSVSVLHNMSKGEWETCSSLKLRCGQTLSSNLAKFRMSPFVCEWASGCNYVCDVGTRSTSNGSGFLSWFQHCFHQTVSFILLIWSPVNIYPCHDIIGTVVTRVKLVRMAFQILFRNHQLCVTLWKFSLFCFMAIFVVYWPRTLNPSISLINVSECYLEKTCTIRWYCAWQYT